MASLRCPLCGSAISRKVYDRVTGLWDERRKLEAGLKARLAEAAAAKKDLLAERKRLRRELTKEFRQRVKEATEKGRMKERRRADQLAKAIERKTEQIEELSTTVRELREQLKKGTTPQLEGLNLEEEVEHELADRFPDDKVERFGKKGDVLHTVRHKGKSVGSILYECKRAKRFNRSFVTQARRGMVQRSATYAVLVTTTFPKDSAGFLVSQDVFVVHPFGVGDLADFLRRGLIELYSLEVSKKEVGRRARVLLDYAQSEEFRNAMEDSIHSTHALRDLLEGEMKAHVLTWKRRWDHYREINGHIVLVRENTRRAVRGEPLLERLDEKKALPPPRQMGPQA